MLVLTRKISERIHVIGCLFPSREGEDMSKGIDWGKGLVNIDPKTGIRYGVISGHHDRLAEWFWLAEATAPEEMEHVSIPACPHCGICLPKTYSDGGQCPECDELIDIDEQWGGDEWGGYKIRGIEYQGEIQSGDSDLFITKSPYYTHAAFCSPCAPGAGDLSSPHKSGEKAYCLGHEWFSGGRAPYPVFSVDSGAVV